MKLRPRDINLNIGVGKKKENSILYLSGPCSTLNKKYLKVKNKYISIIKILLSSVIKIDNISNICKEFIKKDKIIDFCKIDVEGEEKNVLIGFDFENYRPKVFCIESTFPSTNISSFSSWEFILINNNYSFVYQYHINRFYLDNKIPSLKKRFFKLDKDILLHKKNAKNLKNYKWNQL